MHMEPSQPHAEASAPRWQPLSATDRRVLGVLVEKAKTTPDQYPLSLNAARTACNQKSNRFPTMELEEEQVQASLDRLRGLGAVTMVQSGGRIERFRHLLYDWLKVDKVELAVMAELLLRGAQTEGELRTRASRMEPIHDLPTLRDVLDKLKAKNLVVSLTREGRGHVVTHNLYRPEELEKLRRQYATADVGDEPPARERPTPQLRADAPHRSDAAPAESEAEFDSLEFDVLQAELTQLRGEMLEAREKLEQLAAELQSCRDEIQQLKDALGA